MFPLTFHIFRLMLAMTFPLAFPCFFLLSGLRPLILPLLFLLRFLLFLLQFFLLRLALFRVLRFPAFPLCFCILHPFLSLLRLLLRFLGFRLVCSTSGVFCFFSFCSFNCSGFGFCSWGCCCYCGSCCCFDFVSSVCGCCVLRSSGCCACSAFVPLRSTLASFCCSTFLWLEFERKQISFLVIFLSFEPSPLQNGMLQEGLIPGRLGKLLTLLTMLLPISPCLAVMVFFFRMALVLAIRCRHQSSLDLLFLLLFLIGLSSNDVLSL